MQSAVDGAGLEGGGIGLVLEEPPLGWVHEASRAAGA